MENKLTLNFLDDILSELSLSDDVNTKPSTVLTGYGGMMGFHFRFIFSIYGRTKLPRKLKKKVWLSKKLRMEYFPEYYENYR